MGRGGKKKSPKQKEAVKEEEDREPQIVEEVDDSDDEEIDEDEAFNSEDERMFGHFFKKISGGEKGDESSGEDISSDEDGDDDNADDEDDDGGQYMLSLLEKLDTAGKKGANKNVVSSVAQMSKLSESEYSSSISKKGLTLDNLMEGLQDTQGFRNLQQTFSKQKNATPAPMDRVVADRTQRKLAYENQSKNISRWTKVVQENRQAETLDFKPKERLNVTRDTLVDKFEATTDFEKELEQALEAAGQQDEEAVLKAEEQALQDDLGANRLTMEEYKKRRGQLAQVRALMFYHEQKQHHIKKIKSKKYRRIRKKQRERLKENALEAAIEGDEDLANELKEKEEVSRIQERMTLAHKNTSKWAKRILKRGKNVDMETRRALSAQLKRGDDLRKKMMGDDSEASDNDSDEDLVESARKVLADTDDATDPTKGQAGLFKMAFMQKGIEKQRNRARDEARRLLTELESNEADDYDEATKNDNSTEGPSKKAVLASEKEMTGILEKGELVATSLEFGNSNTISTSGGIEIDISTADDDDGDDDDDETHVRASSGMSEHVSTIAVQSKGDEATERESPAHSKKSKKESKVAHAATKRQIEEVKEEANPWLKTSDIQEEEAAPGQSGNKRKKTKKGMVDVAGAVDILDHTPGNDASHSTKTKDQEDGKDASEGEKRISMLTQKELVRRAFASASEKDIEEEFHTEKEKVAAEDDPTRKVTTEKAPNEVSGWGSWAGSGAPPPPRRRKLPKKLQAPKKKDPTRKRKDDGKPNVIINQKRLKKMANNFMLGDVPHPYSSRAEYEQAMLGGVGREWNVTGSFKTMTRPEILTRSGKMIQPISKKAKLARAPAKF